MQSWNLPHTQTSAQSHVSISEYSNPTYREHPVSQAQEGRKLCHEAVRKSSDGIEANALAALRVPKRQPEGAGMNGVISRAIIVCVDGCVEVSMHVFMDGCMDVCM